MQYIQQIHHFDFYSTWRKNDVGCSSYGSGTTYALHSVATRWCRSMTGRGEDVMVSCRSPRKQTASCKLRNWRQTGGTPQPVAPLQVTSQSRGATRCGITSSASAQQQREVSESLNRVTTPSTKRRLRTLQDLPNWLLLDN